MQFLRNIQQGIKNVIYWLPVIWRDRNWDYSHFLYILRHKLDAIRLDIPNWTCTDKEKEAENIEYVITLIDIIVNEEYEQQAFDEHAAIWGRPEMVFEPSNDKLSKMNIVYPGIRDQAVEKEADEELAKLIRDAWDKRRDAIHTLFEIIRDNFESWWD